MPPPAPVRDILARLGGGKGGVGVPKIAPPRPGEPGRVLVAWPEGEGGGGGDVRPLPKKQTAKKIHQIEQKS